MIAFLLAAALAFTPEDAQLAYSSAKQLVDTCTPRDAGTIRGRIAANSILDMASATGADIRRDTFSAEAPSGRREFTNLYGTFRHDPTNRWVVLVAHYDTKPGVKCPGANDGASTSGLLVGIANMLTRSRLAQGNILLVWTDGEECVHNYGPNDGFWGSKRAVDYIAEKGYPIQAVVCLDMLGDRDLEIIVPANGSAALAKIAVHAARKAGYPDLVKLSDALVKDDHVAFLEKGHKAIDLIDFTYGPENSYWHTEKDMMDNISQESLLKSGKILAEMLNILL